MKNKKIESEKKKYSQLDRLLNELALLVNEISFEKEKKQIEIAQNKAKETLTIAQNLEKRVVLKIEELNKELFEFFASLDEKKAKVYALCVEIKNNLWEL